MRNETKTIGNGCKDKWKTPTGESRWMKCLRGTTGRTCVSYMLPHMTLCPISPSSVSRLCMGCSQWLIRLPLVSRHITSSSVSELRTKSVPCLRYTHRKMSFEEKLKRHPFISKSDHYCESLKEHRTASMRKYFTGKEISLKMRRHLRRNTLHTLAKNFGSLDKGVWPPSSDIEEFEGIHETLGSPGASPGC